jgi:hypothetical protein
MRQGFHIAYAFLNAFAKYCYGTILMSYVNKQLILEIIEMIYQQQYDLLERKRRLGWTNREVGNALGIAPGVASSKLNGFIVLTEEERRRLERAMDEAGRQQQTTVK